MKITIRKFAEKFLKRLPANQRERVFLAICALPDGDIKSLRGELGFRLRVGDFRIVYDIIDDEIIVYEIGSRGDIYK